MTKIFEISFYSPIKETDYPKRGQLPSIDSNDQLKNPQCWLLGQPQEIVHVTKKSNFKHEVL